MIPFLVSVFALTIRSSSYRSSSLNSGRGPGLAFFLEGNFSSSLGMCAFSSSTWNVGSISLSSSGNSSV